MFIDERAINDSNEDNLCFSFFTKTYIHLTSWSSTESERVSQLVLDQNLYNRKRSLLCSERIAKNRNMTSYDTFNVEEFQIVK